MATSNDGGPAFPLPFIRTERDGYTEYITAEDIDHGGMSLRDHFAAKALAVILDHELANSRNGQYDPQLVADHAYIMADEMLRARTAQSPKDRQDAHISEFGK